MNPNLLTSPLHILCSNLNLFLIWKSFSLTVETKLNKTNKQISQTSSHFIRGVCSFWVITAHNLSPHRGLSFTWLIFTDLLSNFFFNLSKKFSRFSSWKNVTDSSFHGWYFHSWLFFPFLVFLHMVIKYSVTLATYFLPLILLHFSSQFATICMLISIQSCKQFSFKYLPSIAMKKLKKLLVKVVVPSLESYILLITKSQDDLN